MELKGKNSTIKVVVGALRQTNTRQDNEKIHLYLPSCGSNCTSS